MAEMISPTALLDDLYARWRFGSDAARVQGVGLALDILGQEGATDVIRAVHLRLAMMLSAQDPARSAHHLDLARALGADIPRIVARDESNPPGSSPDRMAEIQIDTVDPASSRQFNPASGDVWHPAFDLAAIALPNLDLAVVRDGFISIDTTRGRPEVYVFDADGVLAPRVSTGAHPFREPAIMVEGPLVLLDDTFASFNVCHALFDKFPRLALYEARFPEHRLCALMFQDTDYTRQALAHLGHDLMALPSCGRFTVQARTLALLSNHRRGEVMHPAFSAAAWATRFLARRFQPAQRGNRRLFISREDASVRRLVNEQQVRATFEAHGFEIHTLSHLDFSGQRALFAGAGWIAGVHGAGLANMAFAAQGTRILEIMPPLAGTHAYWVMAQGLGQPYSLFTAEDAELEVGPGASFDPALGARSIVVDIDRLDQRLAAWLANP